ncbi:MAG TPA: ATP-binding protein, partial [Candidatus Methanofastidiosa archaeon]|nr:ATP-binding protein [Candidatus Methanofastidiosa archaeon]
MIGNIISSTSQEVVFRINDDVDVETIKLATPVVIESRYQYLARVVSLEMRNLGESELPDKVVAVRGNELYGDIDSALGSQFYYICRARLMGIIGKRLQGAKTIPRFKSPVRLAKEEDLGFLGSDSGDKVEIGSLRDLEIPIKLDRKTLITRHCGVFGKTGSGKSNTVKVLLSRFIEAGTPSLVFDVHGEYSRPDGLRPYDNAVVMGIGNNEDVTISIPLERIKPKDVGFIYTLNETQKEAAEAIRRKEKNEWISYIYKTKSEEIYNEFNRQINELTILTLKRKIGSLCNVGYVGTGNDSLRYIRDALMKGKTIIIDFGQYENDDHAIRLITTIISRYLLDAFKNARSVGKTPPETLIVLEEAHKLLSKDIARTTIFETIVREGRKFGLGLLVVDQMPRKIHDEIISQLNTVIIMLLTNIKDREHLVLSSENDLSDFKEEMSRLDVGEAIITGISVPIPLSGTIPIHVPRQKKA